MAQGVDLSAVQDGRLLGQLSEEAKVKAELRAGMRCGGCLRRIKVGFEFSRFVTKVEDGRPTVVRQPTCACANADCDYARKAAAQATVMRPIEFAWLDEVRGPAPGSEPLPPDETVPVEKPES